MTRRPFIPTNRPVPALCLGLLLAMAFFPHHPARARETTPTRTELRTERSWVRQHLTECLLKESHPAPAPLAPPSSAVGLEVLANHDPVTRNGRGPHPLRIGDCEFSRGLYCHAVSRIDVHLPAPATNFTAIVGLDHNDDTARGKGSVIFRVKVGDKLAFESPVMRFGTPGQPVNLDLRGAQAFTLEIGDAGAGIGWDQSDWADARVTLADGQQLWLGDLPLRDRRPEAGPPPVPRTSQLAFSFLYGGKSSDQLLAAWPKKSATTRLDSQRTQHTSVWLDPLTRLEVRCVSVEYADFPAAEWTLYFKNTGPEDTLLLENIQVLDARFPRGTAGECILHGNKGDWCAPDSYEPYQLILAPGTSHRFAPDGGRPTNGPKGWPYFNLQMPGGGFILAVGWPGQWACSFLSDDPNGLRVLAGQQALRLVLHPGEEIRSPLIATLFWQGADTVRAQNLWRRWFLAHNLPRLNGNPPPPMLQMQCYRSFEKGGEKDLFDTVEEFNRAGIDFDLCWRDAGWYPCKGTWPNTGTWEIDPERYPRGFRPFSDWLHQQGKKFIVWFEPERVGDRESWLARQHPDWILGGNLLNLGHPGAWNWLVEHIDTLIREQGIDFYRQDFNMDPLANWRGADPPNRQGITEIKYVVGYLAFWDELRRRHPGLLIDSCASGGRRNDLETLRRSVPLLRSDYQFGHEATTPNQGHTYGLSSWIPYYGSGCYFTDPYSARSYIMPCSGYAGTNAETKRAYAECRQVAPLMLGDYYPLTPYTIAPDSWIAWQFDRPDLAAGVVQAFRHDKNQETNRWFLLKGLSPSATYSVTSMDGGPEKRATGKTLMQEGLSVEINTPRGAAILLYRKVKSARS